MTPYDLYQCHVKNLRAVDSALVQIYRQLKYCLAAKQDVAADALLKTFCLLIGAWAEVRLLKVLYEPSGFSDDARDTIFGVDTQIGRWKLALELGFRHRYGVPHAVLGDNSLPRTASSRYRDLTSLIDEQLTPVVEIRNKLAHGQWCRTLNTAMDDISQDAMRRLNTENALSANYKHRILESLSRLVHDLVTSENAFQRDFDKHFRTLCQLKMNLANHQYEGWTTSLIDKLRRGRELRQDPHA